MTSYHKTIQISKHKIGWDYPPLVIAEIGINHNGSLQTAKEMASAACKAGADIIKHQTHIPEEEMSPEAKQKIPGNSPYSIWDIMSRCALNEADEQDLKKFVEDCGSVFISTPFSFAAVDRLEKFSVPAYKIGSGEMNNLPLVDYVARTGKPIILSTGMNTLDDVRRAVDTLTRHHEQFILMHTTNLYPTPARLVRLGALLELQKAFPNEIIGLSDHSSNNLACLAAVALGACVLERHFTDSKMRSGEDICCSMTPDELKQLKEQSAEIALMRGGTKQPAEEEKVTIEFAFSSIVSARDLPAGTVLCRQDITAKRPAGGIPAADMEKIIGKKLRHFVVKNRQIKWEDLYE